MQPAKEPRGEINPYASPQEAGGYEGRTPYGVGVWRDGRLLVMHKDAKLPPICIHSGHAYWTFGHPLSVAWSRGDYLWLRDVHAGMLQHAPPWVP